ncbi:mitochondrial small ribosomal subunit protein uS17m [Candidatus Gottesmanbacteria bacterium]|nr:mitochondrial small ribosomal subunit protein uS17m [Candidatus Gottesmanbacteria bacterium]
MKTFVGKVIRLMPKTATLTVISLKLDPLYKKQLRRIKKIKAHCELTEVKVGSRVTISETRPISKDKHFKVTEVVK